MGTKGLHVVPSGSKWSVRRAGASRATGIYKTQREAISRARELAQNQKTILYIHGTDGRIRERNSYSCVSHQPKG